MDTKISKYTEKLLNSEIMAVKNRRQEHKKALDEAKKELSKYDDTSKAEKGQGKHVINMPCPMSRTDATTRGPP